MADIDELKFSIILDDSKFKKKMEEVNTLAGKFEQSVKEALAVTNLLDAAQNKGVKGAEQKAKSAEKSAAAAKKELAAVDDLEEKEEKVYKLVELRQKRAEQSGKLTKDEVSALNQMESIEKALLNVREQHKGELAKEFDIMMNEEGMTKQQIGSYRSLVTQMQAATSETAKREAAEKAALMLREQKENAILALKRTIAGIDMEILSTETKAAVQKGLSGQMTAKEIASLRTVITTEKQRYSLRQKNAAEAEARDKALIGLRQRLVGVDREILTEETRQKIAKAESYELDSKAIGKLAAQVELEKKLADETNRRREIATRLSSELTRQSSVMKGLASYVTQYLSVFGAATIIRNLIRITGEFEAQHTALRAILQDTAAADNIYNQLQVLAVKSPYTFQNLVSYAKQLTAFSVPVNEVYETTKKLADVSAGLGVDMGRIILAYGQVRSAEFLRGQEVRQFTEAGIPILKELADQFKEIEGHAVSVGEVFTRISARQVPFAMVEEAFNRMTSAGGKFYQMQEVLAETVKGKVSNLQDAWEIMLSKIGNENSGLIKGAVSGLTNLLSHYETWMTLLGGVVKYLGLYNGALLVLNTLTKGINAATLLWNGLMAINNQQVKLSTVLLPTNIALEKLSIKNKKEEAAAIAALNVARKGAIGVLSLLGATIWALIQRHNRIREEENKTTDTINTSMAKLSMTMAEFDIGVKRVEAAFNEMKKKEGDATEETKKFHDEVDALKSQFPKFIDDNMKLAETVDDLAQYWAKAREEMNKYYADESRETIKTDLKAQRDEDVQKLSKDFTKYITRPFKDAGLGKQQATFAWRYVTGALSRDEIESALDEINKAWQKHNHDSRDYTQDILRNLDDYVTKYQAIMDRYTNGVIDAEEQIKAHSLNTTRQSVNDQLFPLLGMGIWNTANGNQIAYADMTAEQQTQALQIWCDKNDFAFQADDTISSWAARQREKLESGTISEKVADVIKAIFEQLGEPVSTQLQEGTWQKDVADMADNFGDVIRTALEELGTMSENEIDAFVEKNKGHAAKFKAKATDLLADFIADRVKDLDDALKSIKSTPDAYANFSDVGFTQDWLTRLFLQHVSQQFYGEGNVDFSGSTKDSERDAAEEERKRKERERQRREYRSKQISDIKQQFQDLKELKSAYDRFKGLGYDDSKIDALLTDFLGKGIPEGGFAIAFESLAKKMERYSPNDAQDIRNYAAGKDWKEYAKNVEDAQKALKKYEDTLAKLEASDFNLHGKFFEFDLNKVLRDLRNTNGQLDLKYSNLWDDAVSSFVTDDALKEKVKDLDITSADFLETLRSIAEAHGGNADAIAKEAERLYKLLTAEKNYQKQLAQNKVNDMASNYVKNTVMRGKDFTMSDWGDKSIHQVQKIREFFLATLADIEAKGIEVDAQTKADLEALGLDSKDLLELIRQIIAGNYKESTVEYFKKLQGAMKQFSSLGSQIGGTLTNLGDMFGNEIVSDLGSALDYMSKLADIVLSCDALFDSMAESAGKAADSTAETTSEIADAAGTIAKSSDWITMIIKVVLLAIEGIANLCNSVSEAEKEAIRTQRDLTLAAYDYLDALNEIEKKANETFFGTDQLSIISAGWKQAAEAAQNYQKVYQAIIDNFKVGETHQVTVWFWDTAKYKQYKSLWDFIRYKSVNLPDGTYKRLIDENGNLDFDMFKTFWPEWREHTDDNFGYRLDENTIAEGDELLRAIEAYEKTMEEFRDSISEMFNDIASSIADNMISAFKETGDALSDLSTAFEDLGESIVKMMLQSVIVRALKPLEDEILNIWQNYANAFGSDDATEAQKRKATLDAMNGINDVFGKAKNILDDGFWNELLGQAQKIGLIGTGESSDSTVGKGIKSITEDTANLLASYINAIRADVSFGRIQWERIAVAVEGHSDQYITLNDYLAQVAANTFDTAQNTAQMLERFDAFVANFSMASGSGESLKVQIVN